jgi:hypothetical protein
VLHRGGNAAPHSNVHRILLGASFLFLVGALYLWDHGWFFVA